MARTVTSAVHVMHLEPTWLRNPENVRGCIRVPMLMEVTMPKILKVTMAKTMTMMMVGVLFEQRGRCGNTAIQ